MAKRKQESFFSKLETLDAEFPPLKQQVEDSVRDMQIAVPASIAENRVCH
jgi:hypothetical protein